MDSLPFAIKRAHLRTVHALRALAVPFGLTPARFDLMYLVHTGKPHGVRQRGLHERLGLASATVSKMLKRLEELGLLERRTHHADRRKKIVQLSREGTKRMRRVVRRVLKLGLVRDAFDCAFRLPRDRLRFALAGLYADLRIIAARFGDVSIPPYTAACIGDRPKLCPWSIQAYFRNLGLPMPPRSEL